MTVLKAKYCNYFKHNILLRQIIYCRYYNVIGTRIIRPNSEYHAAISVHATSGPTAITATLEGQSFTGTPFLVQFKDVIRPYSSVIARFEVTKK